VLIALTLERIVAWTDHRLLVREAVANLTAAFSRCLGVRPAHRRLGTNDRRRGAPLAIGHRHRGIVDREMIGRLLQHRYDEILAAR